jgi:hypothetical protein
MAEALAGLAVAASVIAVIQISEQVVTACIQYYRTAKDAKADLQAVINVVGGLKTTLENLKMILDATEEEELPHLKSLDKPLEACCGAIDTLAQKLGVNVDRNTDTEKLKFTFTKRIMWPWKEKEVNKVLETIERHKSTFILAVAGDTLQTTLMTQADVGEIKDGFVTLKDDVSDIKTNVSVIPTFVSDQRTERILTWLNPCDPSTNHAAARQKHEPTTGDWFIKSAAFTVWRSAPKASLWLHGIPGAGKTVLCSTIIDHIKTLLAPETQFAYFYFDYNDSQKETVSGMLRSMIFQICTSTAGRFPTAVDDLFRQSNDGHQPPSLQSLTNTFSALLASSPRTYLIIDALDECSERDRLTELIRHLRESSDDASFLVTSRSEQDLLEGLQGSMDVQIDLSHAGGLEMDIDLHVRKSLETDQKLRKWKRLLKKEILNALLQGAQGMYSHTVKYPVLNFT